MRDVIEGLSASGMIVTGARRERVPAQFEPVVEAARSSVRELGVGSLYLYGSVANGAAKPPLSDVDFLTVGVSKSVAAAIERELSAAFRSSCRGVEVATAEPEDYLGDLDEAYGNRVFLRHYCVLVHGPDGRASLPDFPGDVRAARGFNGDIDRHARRWAEALDLGDDAAVLGRRIARKTLLAVAGLVSLHDHCWTTDRATAAQRWQQIDHSSADDLAMLLQWADDKIVPTTAVVRGVLDGIVAATTDSFERTIGLWS